MTDMADKGPLGTVAAAAKLQVMKEIEEQSLGFGQLCQWAEVLVLCRTHGLMHTAELTHSLGCTAPCAADKTSSLGGRMGTLKTGPDLLGTATTMANCSQIHGDRVMHF